MSRITETRFGNRLILVERGSGGVYQICVQAEGGEKVTVEVVFTSQNADSTIAAYAAVCKTLDLLHRAGDQGQSLLEAREFHDLPADLGVREMLEEHKEATK